MQFQSEVARMAFHRLPVENQLFYTKLEESLASSGKFLYVIAVSHGETRAGHERLQVVLCIDEELNLGATRT